MKECRQNPTYCGIIILGDCQRDLVAQGFGFDRANCDPSRGVPAQVILER